MCLGLDFLDEMIYTFIKAFNYDVQYANQREQFK